MSNNFVVPLGEVKIRMAAATDANSLLSLRLEALTLHPESFAADLEKSTDSGAQAWVEMINDYEQKDSGALVVACTPEILVGMLGIVRGHWPKTAHTAQLWGVFVQPAWRGQRVAQAMINYCTDWSKANGVSVLYLGVTTTNESAIRCYTHCGFTVYGTEPRVIYHHEIFYDQYLMVKFV